MAQDPEFSEAAGKYAEEMKADVEQEMKDVQVQSSPGAVDDLDTGLEEDIEEEDVEDGAEP